MNGASVAHAPRQSWEIGRPRTARLHQASTLRQSGDFVQDTLSKLRDDGARTQLPSQSSEAAISSTAPVSRWPQLSPPPDNAEPYLRPDSSAATAAEQGGRAWIMADLERWRKAFREEASEAVRAMHAVVEEASVSQVASKLVKAQEHDGSEMAVLRDHVQELLRLNSSLRQCALDQLSTDEFAKLRSCIVSTMRSVKETAATQKVEQSSQIVAIAERTAMKAAEALDEPVQALSALFRETFNGQQERWQSDDERWQETQHNFRMLQERFDRLENLVRSKTDAQIIGTIHELNEKLRANLELDHQHTKQLLTSELRANIGTVLTAEMPQMAEIIGQEVLPNQTDLLRRVDEIIETTVQSRNLGHELLQAVKEAGQDNGQLKQSELQQAQSMASLEGAMKELHDKFDRFDVAKQSAERWQAEAESGLKEIGRTQEELKKWRSDAQAAQDVSSRVDAEAQDLKTQVKKLQLDATNQPLPAPTVLQKIKALEGRKNIQVDLRTGEVEVLKPMDFDARKTTETPTAIFSDVAGVDRVLRDVAELESIFNVPILVEGHTKGASTEFFEQLASNRAVLVTEHLERMGIEKKLLTAKGYPGKKGVNRACVIIRFDIFPDS